ncbi:MAG: siderophore-interacting protein [Pararhodobacter sp.]|nr:siderophore-interacting protein [Pararhodobacter sp.]
MGLMGPAGRSLGTPEWIALFGDETAMPAIARHLAALPRQTRGAAFILCDPADRQALLHPPGLHLHWLNRGTGDTLCAALSDLKLPASTNRLVWFAAEKTQADRARTLLHDLRCLTRQETHVTAYWRHDTS